MLGDEVEAGVERAGAFLHEQLGFELVGAVEADLIFTVDRGIETADPAKRADRLDREGLELAAAAGFTLELTEDCGVKARRKTVRGFEDERIFASVGAAGQPAIARFKLGLAGLERCAIYFTSKPRRGGGGSGNECGNR